MPTLLVPASARRGAAALLAALLSLGVGSQAVTVSAATTRASVSSNGVQTDDDSEAPQLSATGRYVVFVVSPTSSSRPTRTLNGTSSFGTAGPVERSG